MSPFPAAEPPIVPPSFSQSCGVNFSGSPMPISVIRSSLLPSGARRCRVFSVLPSNRDALAARPRRPPSASSRRFPAAPSFISSPTRTTTDPALGMSGFTKLISGRSAIVLPLG